MFSFSNAHLLRQFD